MKYSFDWDPAKEATNLRKHGVSFRRAATVFQEEHSQQDDRWITLRIDNIGIVQVVIHTFEQGSDNLCHIRIISARKATRAEILQCQESEG
ncbi:MAG: hypothetical protein DCF21_22230 [Leptolyngbya sp.]|nr:MAG: hypothetical protein DCF21_22230 [Leptolyngbya sp.]